MDILWHGCDCEQGVCGSCEPGIREKLQWCLKKILYSFSQPSPQHTKVLYTTLQIVEWCLWLSACVSVCLLAFLWDYLAILIKYLGERGWWSSSSSHRPNNSHHLNCGPDLYFHPHTTTTTVTPLAECITQHLQCILPPLAQVHYFRGRGWWFSVSKIKTVYVGIVVPLTVSS